VYWEYQARTVEFFDVQNHGLCVRGCIRDLR
jgi:hypothetical protein